MKGRFRPKNPHKYRGNPTNIIYRSSYELKLFRYLDIHPSIEWWQSEEVIIPYRSPITGRVHRYFPDFYIKFVNDKGQSIREIIEVKPKNQTMRESVGKSRFNQEQYIKNMAKWEAAGAWCKQKRVRFRIVNEEDIFHTGNKRR